MNFGLASFFLSFFDNIEQAGEVVSASAGAKSAVSVLFSNDEVCADHQD